MHKLLLLLGSLLLLINVRSQDFTNKGSEFWIGYGNHVRMFESITAQNAAEKMQLYMTSDVNTTGTVNIPGVGFSMPFTVTANQITTIDIPRSAALLDEGIYNLGIHVTALKPIVVYSFIYVNAVSGATLCLPVTTLGREYYSINYTQVSNQPNSYSYFNVIATDTGVTSLEIIPAQNTRGGHAAGKPYYVQLNRGEVYQALGVSTSTNNPYTGADLTGSLIRSISTGTNKCKKIAVFCGSGKMAIGCPGSGTSDNLYQQMYPVSTWGKTFITVPTINKARSSSQNNFYRVFKSDPTATVKLNGTLIPAAGFTNNQYYEFSSLESNYIDSDKPILVAQYLTTPGCAGNIGQGDPEMIYLNPVEQTITQVTLNSMQPVINTNINEHHINVVLKNTPAVINSFKVDGLAPGPFTPLAANPAYAYAQITVNRGPHTLVCDSGFNAIAYGFGNAESYGYSAGTNLKDLYQFVGIHNEYATVNFAAGCKGSPFKFSMTFPYQPVKIKWLFKGLLADTTVNLPAYDSTWVVSGRTLYRYKLNRPYIVQTLGTYPITVIADNPTADGCSGEQVIEYDLQIFNPPGAGFTATQTGCLKDPVTFADTSESSGRPVISWSWDFGDGSFSKVKNPAHSFSSAGRYKVRLSAITDIGCLSDTFTLPVAITDPPVAKFEATSPLCEKSAAIFTDNSSITIGNIGKWIWDFGDGTKVTSTDRNPVSHTYSSAGVFAVSLQVSTSAGCSSTVNKQDIHIRPKPLVTFTLPAVCLPGGDAQFTSLSSISDASPSPLSYAWEFGDGNTSTAKDPLHHYTKEGPFPVKLQVSSVYGCKADTTRLLKTIFPQAKAGFSISPEACLGATTIFTDKSSGNGSQVKEWQWSFGDGTVSSLQNPSHSYQLAGTYIVKLAVVTSEGCRSDTMSSNAVVNALPLAGFTIKDPVCAARQVSLFDASIAGSGDITRWKWNFDDGTTSTVKDPVYTFSTAKVYNIQLEVETGKGCKSNKVTKAVPVFFVPRPGFSTPEICLSDPFAQFYDSSAIGDNSQNQFAYKWFFGDPGSGNTNSSTIKDPTHRYTSTGVYDVHLLITSKDGCSAEVTKKFTVNGSVPKADFTVKDESRLCSNTGVIITDQSSVDFGAITKVEVYWDYRNDPSVKTLDEEPLPGRTYRHAYANFATPASKTVEVLYVAYSGINCVEQKRKTITLQASPQVQFDPPVPVCEESAPFAIIQAREVTGFAGSGTFTGNGVSPDGIFNPKTAKAGLHKIRYSFTAANSCSVFREQSIRVYPTPLADAGPDRTVLHGGTIVLAAKGSANASYLWTPNTAMDNNAALTPKITPLGDLTYRLKVTSADGCTATDDVLVKVLKEVKVPNAFSPNGDGVNDTWKIDFLESYPGATVQVYDRSGRLVFSSVNYTKEWNGMFKGTPLPFATYYYVIIPGNGRTQLNGSVTIIR